MAVSSTCVRPRSSRNCARAAANPAACRTRRRRRPGSGRRRSPARRDWRRRCAPPSHRQDAAPRSAADTPSACAARFSAASSMLAGWMSKRSPAAASSARREAEPEARTRRRDSCCSMRVRSVLDAQARRHPPYDHARRSTTRSAQVLRDFMRAYVKQRDRRDLEAEARRQSREAADRARDPPATNTPSCARSRPNSIVTMSGPSGSLETRRPRDDRGRRGLR